MQVLVTAARSDGLHHTSSTWNLLLVRSFPHFEIPSIHLCYITGCSSTIFSPTAMKYIVDVHHRPLHPESQCSSYARLPHSDSRTASSTSPYRLEPPNIARTRKMRISYLFSSRFVPFNRADSSLGHLRPYHTSCLAFPGQQSIQR